MERYRDKFLKEFPGSKVSQLDGSLFLGDYGHYIKNESSGEWPSITGKKGTPLHELISENESYVLVGDYSVDEVIKWIKSEKKTPKNNPNDLFKDSRSHRFLNIFYKGDDVITVTSRPLYLGEKLIIHSEAGYINDELFWQLNLKWRDGEYLEVDLGGKEPTAEDLEYWILKEKIIG